MDRFNSGSFNQDSQSFIYQQSNEDLPHQNFMYQDSCVFLHDYKDDSSCQEGLLPKFIPNHHESQESSYQVSQSQAYDETLTQKQETQKNPLHTFKHKAIQKQPKTHRKKQKKIPKSESKDTKPKQTGNKSRFNNFGGFLIGSLAEILSKSKGYRIINGNYEILVSGEFVTIYQGKLDHENGLSEILTEIIRKLKKEIGQLSRKQGAKKHLFRLVNKGSKDSQERKECKGMIRHELIYYLSQQAWLQEHASSREFHPKGDDELGTKKKERHESYMIYLRAIRQALIEQEELPKRLAL